MEKIMHQIRSKSTFKVLVHIAHKDNFFCSLMIFFCFYMVGVCVLIIIFTLKLQLSGARRLRDAIVLGYELQRVPGRDLSIPDWYDNAQSELGLSNKSPTSPLEGRGSHMES